MNSYQDANAAVIDRWVAEGWEWGKPVDHQTYLQAQDGQWSVLLTPTKPVPHEWFGSLKGKKILELASGGGQQMPVFTAAGAECTVLDYSEEQLESERTLAEREGYRINIVRADMSKPLPFTDDSFDLIFHPVSNLYIEKVEPVFAECLFSAAEIARLKINCEFAIRQTSSIDCTFSFHCKSAVIRNPRLLIKAAVVEFSRRFPHTQKRRRVAVRTGYRYQLYCRSKRREDYQCAAV